MTLFRAGRNGGASPVPACALPACALLACALLAGCGGPDPTALDTTLDATRTINPNAAGVANPVVVRVYALASKDTFTSAEFTPLYTDDRQTLAADIIGRNEFEIRPGDTKVIAMPDVGTAAYVGVLAAFRDVANAKWRDTADLKKNGTNTFLVHLDLGSVTITKPKTSWWHFW